MCYQLLVQRLSCLRAWYYSRGRYCTEEGAAPRETFRWSPAELRRGSETSFLLTRSHLADAAEAGEEEEEGSWRAPPEEEEEGTGLGTCGDSSVPLWCREAVLLLGRGCCGSCCCCCCCCCRCCGCCPRADSISSEEEENCVVGVAEAVTGERSSTR